MKSTILPVSKLTNAKIQCEVLESVKSYTEGNFTNEKIKNMEMSMMKTELLLQKFSASVLYSKLLIQVIENEKEVKLDRLFEEGSAENLEEVAQKLDAISLETSLAIQKVENDRDEGFKNILKELSCNEAEYQQMVDATLAFIHELRNEDQELALDKLLKYVSVAE